MEFDWEEGCSYEALQRWFRASMTRQMRAPAVVELPALVRPRVRVATFNVQMLSGHVLDDVLALNADVLVLNEFAPLPNSHSVTTGDAMAEQLAQHGYRHGSWSSSPSYTKVTFVTVIFSRLPLARVTQHFIDGERHVVHVVLAESGLHVWGVHLDVYDDTGATRLRQLRQLETLLAREPDAPLVMAGDFNALRRRDYTVAQWTKLCRHDAARHVETESATIDFVEKNLRFECCFVRADTPPPLVTTWSGRRIDFLFCRGPVDVKAASWRPCCSSDHIPVMMDVEVPHKK